MDFLLLLQDMDFNKNLFNKVLKCIFMGFDLLLTTQNIKDLHPDKYQSMSKLNLVMNNSLSG